jgi:4-amino-4-deoxy-L-arabinose transferase-like glycosyltransferase
MTILTISFLLRVTWSLLIPVLPISDSGVYDLFARTIVEHGVYGWTADQPTAYWPVGTSAIYAAFYWLFGQSFTPIIILNIVLSTSIVGLTMRLGRTFFGEPVALIAGAIIAIWPGQIAYVTILASEIPFTFFVLLSFAAWFSPKWSGPSSALLSGLALAAASYVRPVALLLPLIFWLASLPLWRTVIGQIPKLLLTFIVIAVCVAPWSIRNSIAFGHFVVLSTNGGANLWMGNNPASDGFYTPLPDSMDGLNEAQRDKALGETAKNYILADPLRFFVRTIKKAIWLHTRETIAVVWNEEGIKQRFGEKSLLPLKVIGQVFWMATLLFALAGLPIILYTRGVLAFAVQPAVLTWLYFTVVYAVTVVQDRYHFPSDPFIAMIAAVAVSAAAQQIQTNFADKQGKPGTTPAGVPLS